MKCQICNKHEADVIVGLHNGKEENNIYLCHSCINKFGFDLHENILKGILSVLGNGIPKNIACSNCGRTLYEYLQTGRYGCNECHKYFDNQQSNDNESKKIDMDKRLNKAAEQDKINRENVEEFFSNDTFKSEFKNIFFTKKLLFEAIKAENYEEAARLRDRLKKISNEHYK